MILQEVHEQLMTMHKQFVCPKDSYFLEMAECIQRTIDFLADDDNDIVIDDLFAKVDRLERENLKLRAFIRDRVADRSVMLTRKSGYHARRICLEAEKILQETDQ